jgi:hypothetical protein
VGILKIVRFYFLKYVVKATKKKLQNLYEMKKAISSLKILIIEFFEELFGKSFFELADFYDKDRIKFRKIFFLIFGLFLLYCIELVVFYYFFVSLIDTFKMIISKFTKYKYFVNFNRYPKNNPLYGVGYCAISLYHVFFKLTSSIKMRIISIPIDDK